VSTWTVKTWSGARERVEARSLDVAAGCLVFGDDWSRPLHVYAAGQWSHVELDDEGPPPPLIPPVGVERLGPPDGVPTWSTTRT